MASDDESTPFRDIERVENERDVQQRFTPQGRLERYRERALGTLEAEREEEAERHGF